MEKAQHVIALRPICPVYLRDYNSRCLPLRWSVNQSLILTLSRFACVDGP